MGIMISIFDRQSIEDQSVDAIFWINSVLQHWSYGKKFQGYSPNSKDYVFNPKFCNFMKFQKNGSL